MKIILAFSECEANYRTNSLPAWGKLKQRPVTINDDIATLYVKVCVCIFFSNSNGLFHRILSSLLCKKGVKNHI